MITYSKEEILKSIQAARDSEVAVVFKEMILVNPSWASFITMIDKASRTPARDIHLGSPLEERLVNSLIVRNLFYLTVGFSDNRDVREIQQVYEIFEDIFNGELAPVSAFVNIIGGEKPGEAHHDERETIFWQCIGSSEWTVYEDPTESKYEVSSLKIKNQFVLNPGDILYLKNKGIHSVKNYGPRAAIALAPMN